MNSRREEHAIAACSYDGERLKEVYGLRTDGCTPCKLAYCQLQCWHGTAGPNSTCKLTQEPPEHQLSHQLHTSFQTRCDNWSNAQLQALKRSPAENVSAAVQNETDATVNSSDNDTPKGRKHGLFSCSITQNGRQAKPQWGGQGVMPVDTPPRKRAREEDSTPVNVALRVKSSAAVCESKVAQQMEVVLDTDDEGDDEENRGGVLTQPGIQMM